MYARRFRRIADPYRQEHHMSRTVQCSDCGAQLHKNHHFVYYGNRCRPCWQKLTDRQNESAHS